MLTSLDFLRPKEPWPPLSERERLKDYEDSRKFFERKHGEVFQAWQKILREDIKTSVLIVLNWHKRLSLLWADLLLGEPPRIRGGETDSAEQSQVQRLIRENQLFKTAYAVAIDISRYGTGIFKLRYKDRAFIEGQPPNVWFPVVAPDNIKETTHHVLGWTFVEQDRWYLKVEVHERGRITHRLFLLVNDLQTNNQATLKIKEELGIAVLPRYANLTPVEETGIDDFLVFPVSGVVTTDSPEGMGPNDYEDIDPIISELMIRFSQVARILDKHADPNMAGPDTAIEEDLETGEPKFIGGGKYFPVAPGDNLPQYVTWEGELTAAYTEIEKLMQQLYIISETSPAAFGQLEQGLAESGSALRRLMMAPLAKVNRIRLNLDPTLKAVITSAAQLEKAQSRKDSTELVLVDIEWRDGLPEDMTETINNENVALSAFITSRESSIKRTYGLEGKALKEELARIQNEKKADMDLIAPPDERPDTKTKGGGDE